MQLLLVSLALLCVSGNAADYSQICKTPSKYTPNTVIAEWSGATCNEAMQWHTAVPANTGSELSGLDFSSAFSCASESDKIKGVISAIAHYCCGGSPAPDSCVVDFSHVCKTPSKYTPNKQVAQFQGMTCNQVMQFHTEVPAQKVPSFRGKTFHPHFRVRTNQARSRGLSIPLPMSAVMDRLPLILRPDFSHVCKTPASYTPDGTFQIDDEGSTFTITCDGMMVRAVYYNGPIKDKDFSSAFACADESQDVKNTVNTIADKCCGSGSAESKRSACYVDYSHICKTPSKYTPDKVIAEWSGATCNEAMRWHTAVPANNGALLSKDFSSAFSCTSESDGEKQAISVIAHECCGGSPPRFLPVGLGH